VKPGAIVALGATAARSLLGRSVTIGKLRGQTLHPAGFASGERQQPSFNPRKKPATSHFPLAKPSG
jgi:uracil-DNA glycosylase